MKYEFNYYTSVQLLIAVFILFISRRLLIAQNNDNIDFSLLMDNWKSDFISDIYTTSAETSCNVGDTNLINLNFPGTYQGCLCEDETLVKNKCCNKNQESLSEQPKIQKNKKIEKEFTKKLNHKNNSDFLKINENVEVINDTSNKNL